MSSDPFKWIYIRINWTRTKRIKRTKRNHLDDWGTSQRPQEEQQQQPKNKTEERTKFTVKKQTRRRKNRIHRRNAEWLCACTHRTGQRTEVLVGGARCYGIVQMAMCILYWAHRWAHSSGDRMSGPVHRHHYVSRDTILLLIFFFLLLFFFHSPHSEYEWVRYVWRCWIWTWAAIADCFTLQSAVVLSYGFRQCAR